MVRENRGVDMIARNSDRPVPQQYNSSIAAGGDRKGIALCRDCIVKFAGTDVLQPQRRHPLSEALCSRHIEWNTERDGMVN
jgi:hypothetical protein